MLTMTASELRKELFHALERVAHGESVQIKWKGVSVARLTPTRQIDWREGMSEQPRLMGSPESVFAPLEDVWEEHVQ